MMSFIRFLFFILILIIVVTFSINNREFIRIDLFPFGQNIEIQVFGLVLISLLVGFLLSYIIIKGKEYKTYRKIKEDSKTIKALNNEIEGLKIDNSIKKLL